MAMHKVEISIGSVMARIDELEAIGAAHQAEGVGEAWSQRHPFKLDRELIGEAEAHGLIFGVFADDSETGGLAGYLTWQVELDPDSDGKLLARQGAWYVVPGVNPAIAMILWRRSLAELRRRGIDLVHLFAPVEGRGKELGRLFQLVGATPIGTAYALWLGGTPDA